MAVMITTHDLHIRDHLRWRWLSQDGRQVIDLIHVVVLDCRRQFGGLSNVASNQNDLVQHVDNPLFVRIAIEQYQVFAGDALFTNQMAHQVGAEKSRPTFMYPSHLRSIPQRTVRLRPPLAA